MKLEKCLGERCPRLRCACEALAIAARENAALRTKLRKARPAGKVLAREKWCPLCRSIKTLCERGQRTCLAHPATLLVAVEVRERVEAGGAGEYRGGEGRPSPPPANPPPGEDAAPW